MPRAESVKKRWASLILLLLAACATSDDLRAVDTCVATGRTPEVCECLASKDAELLAQEIVSIDTVRIVQLGMEGKSAEADRLLLTMPYEQRFIELTLLASARNVCFS